jgi:branched-subunit amino acid ABC-type transport system permease component
MMRAANHAQGALVAEGRVLPFLPFTLFGHRIFAAWVVDFVLAFLFGIAFQYFTIRPMKQLTPGQR